MRLHANFNQKRDGDADNNVNIIARHIIRKVEIEIEETLVRTTHQESRPDNEQKIHLNAL